MKANIPHQYRLWFHNKLMALQFSFIHLAFCSVNVARLSLWHCIEIRYATSTSWMGALFFLVVLIAPPQMVKDWRKPEIRIRKWYRTRLYSTKKIKLKPKRKLVCCDSRRKLLAVWHSSVVVSKEIISCSRYLLLCRSSSVREDHFSSYWLPWLALLLSIERSGVRDDILFDS